MTKVITRFFESAEQARKARHELLYRRRVSGRIVHFFDEADSLVATLTSAHVPEKTAKAYQNRMANGGAVLMVEAGYKPLGVAQIARDVAAEMGATPLDGVEEEVTVEDTRRPTMSILRDHPRFMTRPRDPHQTNHYMADWPIPLISRRKPFAEMLFPPHSRMADFLLPLISRRKPYDEFSIPRHGRMADMFLPLISRRKPYSESAIPRHGRMADFPIPLISKREPYTESVFPRHQRMANWPFPLLINRKSTNSLIPGGPRMANFPIPLLSDREPYTGSAIPKHGRMANWPISLTSRREPFNELAFPRHARMADMFLPLVIRKGDTALHGGKGFSLSRLLGIPTLIRRQGPKTRNRV